MQYVRLTAIFLSGALVTGIPLTFLLLFIFWFLTQDASYIDFINSNSTSAQYSAVFAFMFSLLVGMLISLNLIVYLNARRKWYSVSAIKAMLGKELQRYVFVPYS